MLKRHWNGAGDPVNLGLFTRANAWQAEAGGALQLNSTCGFAPAWQREWARKSSK